MTRRKRWPIWLAVIFGALITGVLVGYLVVVPRLIGGQVREALNRAGLANATFELRRAGLWGTTIANLDAGGDRMTQVQSIDLEYGPSIVLTRQIDKVQISGAEVILRLREGQVDAGVLGKLLTAPAPAPATHPTPTTSQQSAPAAQVIPAIKLGPSTLVLETANKRQLRVPVHGTLKHLPDGSYKVDVLSDTKPKPVTISATITASGKIVELTANAESLDLQMLSLVLEGLAPASDIVVWGQTAAKLDLTWSGTDGSAKIRADMRDLGLYKGAKLHVPKGVILVDANFGSAQTPLTVSATLDVPLMGIGDIWLANGAVKVAMNDARNITVQENRWSWLGGTLSTQPFSVEFAQAQAAGANIVFEAKEIDLKQLLEYFAKDRASGEGRLNGHLAMKLDASGVDFGEGHLETSGGGVLRIGNVPGLDEALTAGRGKKASAEDQAKANVVEALGDFEYEILRADLTKTDEGLAAYVQVAGRGRAGARQAIDYELRLRGLDYLIKLYLGLQGVQ